MKKLTRIAIGSAVLAGGLAIAGASTANAQVRIGGSFPLPHGRISFSVGDPFFPVGAYVPYGYSVYEDPYYGYGFEYEDRWIPCEPRGSRWIVVESPYYGHGGYYGRGDHYRSYGYSSRDHRRWDDRRYSRNDRRWNDRDRRDRHRRYRDRYGRERRW